MKFNVRLIMDIGTVLSKNQNAKKNAQYKLDNAVLMKINSSYLPFRDGILAASGVSNSSIGNGQIVWATPYARRHYYNPQYNFDQTKNSQAGGMWFERAKSAHLNEWLKLAQKEYGNSFRG